jgi:hypothetical protein
MGLEPERWLESFSFFLIKANYYSSSTCVFYIAPLLLTLKEHL